MTGLPTIEAVLKTLSVLNDSELKALEDHIFSLRMAIQKKERERLQLLIDAQK